MPPVPHLTAHPPLGAGYSVHRGGESAQERVKGSAPACLSLCLFSKAGKLAVDRGWAINVGECPGAGPGAWWRQLGCHDGRAAPQPRAPGAVTCPGGVCLPGQPGGPELSLGGQGWGAPGACPCPALPTPRLSSQAAASTTAPATGAGASAPTRTSHLPSRCVRAHVTGGGEGDRLQEPPWNPSLVFSPRVVKGIEVPNGRELTRVPKLG